MKAGRVLKKIIGWCVYWLDYAVPKKPKNFVFCSYPDVSDNAYGMFCYLFQMYRGDGYRFIWLVGNKYRKDEYREGISIDLGVGVDELGRLEFVKKKSLRGIWLYVTSKYIFFTHAAYSFVEIPPGHVVVNLWHGMPLKSIGRLDPNNMGIPTSSYVISTSVFFQSVMSKAFSKGPASVLVSGQPRNDLMFSGDNGLSRLGIDRDKFEKVVLWTPTYRRSIFGDVRSDGVMGGGLPVVGLALEELNDVIRGINSILIVKLHPMDELNRASFQKLSNIVVLRDDDLRRIRVPLYRMLGGVDVLLTDFSSIYIDYLLVDRPIGFVVDDIEEYGASRGFVVDRPVEFMPGSIISNIPELTDFLIASANGEDEYRDERRSLNKVLNIQCDSYSGCLWDILLSKEAGGGAGSRC